jgi:hypothetical protein
MARILAVITLILISPVAVLCAIEQPGPEGKDTYVYIQTSNPKGGEDYLYVSRGTDAEGLLVKRTYVEFDLSDPKYSGITVDLAELRLWSPYEDEPSEEIGVYQVSNSWNEATLVFENQPIFDTHPADTLKSAGDYYYFEVTNLVQYWVSGIPNYGLVIKYTDESVPNDGFVAYSGDFGEDPAKRPMLIIWSEDLSVEPSSFGAIKSLFR